MQVLTETLSLVNPAAFGRANRLRKYDLQMAAALRLADTWQYEVAAMLSQIGCVTVPAETLDKVYAGRPLTPEEADAYRAHPAVGANLISHIPRLQPVARMIEMQSAAASNVPASTPGSERDEAVLGAGMLRAAISLDDRLTRGQPLAAAIEEMRASGKFMPSLLAGLTSLSGEDEGMEIRSVMLAGLMPHMVLDQDVHSRRGMLLLAKGQEVTVPVIERLKNFARDSGIVEPMRVLVPKQRSKPAAAA